MANLFSRNGTKIQDAPFMTWLLNNPRAGWIWVFLRVWLGYQWLEASLHKITNPAWVGTGAALKGFWAAAVAIPAAPAKPAIAYEWYRAFLQMMLNAQAYTWFAKLVAYGELLIGIGLILGAFTGIAAFFGGLMNWNFMMAGSASTNPVLLLAAIALVLAWKVAGNIGADHFILPIVRTPWQWRKPVETAPAAQAGD